jgi:hypothetical protein
LFGADVNRTARDSFISLDRAEQIAQPDYFGVVVPDFSKDFF